MYHLFCMMIALGIASCLAFGFFAFLLFVKRLADIKGRGVVLKEGQDLHDLFLERTPLYEQYADIRISEEGLNVEQTVEQIIEKLELMNNNRKSNE